MKLLTRLMGFILFIVFFSFALKNTQEAVIRFFFNYEIRGPLILLLLIFVVVGSVLGVLAMMPTMFRQRQEIVKNKELIQALQRESHAEQDVNV